MSIQELYEEANSAFFNQENDKANQLLDKILKQDSQYAPAYALKGHIANSDFENPNGTLSIEYYTKAIEANPNSKEYRLDRANAYMLIPQEMINKEGFNFDDETKYYHFYEKAIADCDYVTNEMESDEYPEDWIAGAYEKKADAYLSMKQADEAISNYQMAKNMSERYTSGSFSKIATIQESQEKYEDALQTFNEYVAYCNNSESQFADDNTKAEAYYYRGKLKIDWLNQKEDGLADLKKASEFGISDFYTEEYENYLKA